MPGLSVFKFLSKAAPYQLYRFAMDGDKQSSDPGGKKWESREPGSLRGVLDGYAYTVPLIQEGKEKKITVDDIREIHKRCTSQVKIKGDFGPGQFRNIQQFFGIDKTNSSVKGVKALLKSHKDYPYHMWYLDPGEKAESKNLRRLLNERSGGGITFWGYNGGLSEEEGKEFLDLQRSGLKSSPRYIELSEKFIKNMNQEIEKTLDTMYSELSISDSENSTLTAIAKAIQRLEHIHPFQDGNCRTFCMVLLNTLLMQYGYSPALISNPNMFDGYEINELVEIIKKGIEKTNSLIGEVTNEYEKQNVFFDSSAQSMKVPEAYQQELIDFSDSIIQTLSSIPEDTITLESGQNQV